MIKLILLPLAITILGISGTLSVVTGAIKTPMLENKYAELEDYQPVDSVSSTTPVSQGEPVRTSGDNTVVITQQQANKMLNSMDLSGVSLKTWADKLPDSLRRVINPVLSLGGFELNDINIVFKPSEAVVSGHLAKSGKVPFYLKIKAVSTRPTDIDILITQASIGLYEIKGGNLSTLNVSLNEQLDNYLEGAEGLNIESLAIEEGRVVFKGTLPRNLLP